MLSAHDHLDLVHRALLDPTRTPPPMALYSATRGALLGSCLALWVLGCEDEPERRGRALALTDFTANPAAERLGALGVCHVRFGKAMRGSPPRRRAVASVMPWAVEALAEYLEQVRPLFEGAAPGALWPTERGGRISTRSVDDRFALYRAAAGFPTVADGVVGALPAALLRVAPD